MALPSFDVGSDPEALPPGAKRVETASLVIQAYAQSEPYYAQFLDQFIVEKDQLLKNAEELRIELDAVIFADGRLIGKDQDGWLSDTLRFERFKSSVMSAGVAAAR